jgi:hypothetical protein
MTTVVAHRPAMRRRLHRWVDRQRRRILFVVLLVHNRISRRSAVGEADVVVSLATHSSRIAQSFQAVESIARGRTRPRRLIVCLPQSADGSTGSLPSSLRRLERRGVEIWWCEDRGPHNKYFPYLTSQAEHLVPLVTADDDCAYPRGWLSALLEAHRRDPGQICAPRCRTMGFEGSSPAPYATWPLAITDQPSPRRFFTGVSGVLYPPSFLAVLARRGDPSGHIAEVEDDVWINATAAATSTPVRQLAPKAATYTTTLRSGEGLYHRNRARKDEIIRATYDPDLLEVLSEATT